MGGNVRNTNDRRSFGLDDNGQLRGGEHLLRALLQAKGEEMFRDLGTGDPSRMQQLVDSFGATGNLSTAQLAQILRNGGVPPGLSMPRPQMMQGRAGQGYAGQRSLDFGAANSPLGRFLRNNPHERQQLEMALGGRIVPGDGDDGRLSIMPFTGGAFPAGGRDNTTAFNAQAMLADLARASGNGGVNPYEAGAFQGMVLSALQHMAQNPAQTAGQDTASPQGFSAMRQQGATNPFVDWSGDSPNQARRRNMFGISGGNPVGTDISPMNSDSSAMSSMGMSSQACSGNSSSSSGGGDDISAMLGSGGLTVEDKITLMIMMIMKKMDQDIEKQANYINSLQQQQQAGGAGGGGGAPSIDVETMKLKRLIDKRSQMFDMLRQIIDKYNQTAKGIIDQMGR
jgi:hypothetical protein